MIIKDYRESPSWNAASLILVRQDKYLNDAQNLHHAGRTNRSVQLYLEPALSAFKEGYVLTYHVWDEKDRNKFVRSVDKLEAEIKKYKQKTFNETPEGVKQAIDEYQKMHSDLFKLFSDFFGYQQRKKLGIPTKRVHDQDDELRKAFE